MAHIDIAAHEWQIIFNPHTPRQKRIEIKKLFSDTFEAQHIPYQIHITNGQNQGMLKAKDLCLNGKRHFIVIGGDGTINEVINGIYESGIDTSTVYVSIIPLGTGNDYARTLQLSHQPEKTLKTFLSGNYTLNDVGIAETTVHNEVVGKRYFVNIAGFAFDAAVIHKTVNSKPAILPSMVYLINLLKVLFKYRCSTVTIKTAQESVTTPVFTIAVGIAQYNGNGMRQVPMANPHDRLFDIVVIKKISPWKVISKVKQLFSGKHIETLQEAMVFKSDEVEINAEEPVWGEVEGEMLKKGNYHIYNAPAQININCPAENI